MPLGLTHIDNGFGPNQFDENRHYCACRPLGSLPDTLMDSLYAVLRIFQFPSLLLALYASLRPLNDDPILKPAPTPPFEWALTRKPGACIERVDALSRHASQAIPITRRRSHLDRSPMTHRATPCTKLRVDRRHCSVSILLRTHRALSRPVFWRPRRGADTQFDWCANESAVSWWNNSAVNAVFYYGNRLFGSSITYNRRRELRRPLWQTLIK